MKPSDALEVFRLAQKFMPAVMALHELLGRDDKATIKALDAALVAGRAAVDEALARKRRTR